MQEAICSAEASQDHRDKCQEKINILLNKEQICLQLLMILTDIENGINS
jgi:hypothetical protein